MTVRVLAGGSVSLPVGGVWEMTVAVLDADGIAAAEEPVITVTTPAAGTATPDVELVCAGVYRAVYVTAAGGRHTARAVTATLGAADLTAYATAITAAAAMPDLDDLRGDPGGDPPTYGYLGQNTWTDAELQGALDAEAAAQRSACRVPAAYPADLREALLRRVAVNLAKRQLPLMMLQGDAEAGSTTSFVPGRDAEVRRLEGPFRKLRMG